MRVCKNCSTVIKEETDYCPKCGEPLGMSGTLSGRKDVHEGTDNISAAQSQKKKYSVIDSYKELFKKFAVCKGRTSKGAYQCVLLTHTLIYVAAIILMNVILDIDNPNVENIAGFVFAGVLIYTLIMIIPMWTMTVRRLHDTDRSGNYMFLVICFPIIIYLWLMNQPGDGATNDYGPLPD